MSLNLYTITDWNEKKELFIILNILFSKDISRFNILFVVFINFNSFSPPQEKDQSVTHLNTNK